MKFINRFFLLAVLVFALNQQASAGELHQPFDQLLQKYVVNGLVKYDDLHRAKKDVALLRDYVHSLEQINPEKMNKKEALAYWINLYNAVTLRLIIDNYPVGSIKDIGGIFSSPWKKKLVIVNGKNLTLNQIENEIIRPKFKDARIHFALNCASIGCPPLAAHAYQAGSLDRQLDKASKIALSQENWLKIDKSIRVSKIFNWYGQDFIDYSGSVRQYLARYRPDLRETILDEKKSLKFMDYNWDLNKTK